MTTLEIKHKVPVTVETAYLTLPFFFSIGQYSKMYFCVTADKKIIGVSPFSAYKGIHVHEYQTDTQMSEQVYQYMNSSDYAQVDEAIFHHHFSIANRHILQAYYNNQPHETIR